LIKNSENLKLFWIVIRLLRKERGARVERYELQQIMHEHGDYLVRLSYVYVKSWAVAEDVVQDVFIKFYETENRFEQRAALKTYLAKMTIHKSCDYLRSVKGRLQILRQAWKTASISDVSAEERTLKKLQENEVARAVLNLPLKYREVIVLYYYEEMTSNAIASLLSIPESTVKTRLKRGREQLKLKLAPIDSEVNWNE